MPFLNNFLTFSSFKNFKPAWCLVRVSSGGEGRQLRSTLDLLKYALFIEIVSMSFLKQPLNGYDLIGQIFTSIIF